MTFFSERDLADIKAGRKTIHIVPLDLFPDEEIECQLQEHGLRLERPISVCTLSKVAYQDMVDNGTPTYCTQYGRGFEDVEEEFLARWNNRYSSSPFSCKAEPFVKIIRFKKDSVK